MRASRLLSILTTLQARGRVTAGVLAEACEVSLRTIYRDIDALSAAGVPVYSDRGPEGGYRLLDGYRTRLNGLSRVEAESLFLSGLPGPAALLGLDGAMAAAELKLLAAMPEDLRRSAETARARFYLDAAAWFEELEQPPALRQLAAAVWSQSCLAMRYQTAREAVERRVDPLGLVLKNGVWYVVGRVSGGLRTYRVSRILDLTALDETFEPPEGFDLGAYWQVNAQSYEDSLYRERAVVRLSPRGLERLRAFDRTRARAGAEAGSASEPDADGWLQMTLPMESVREMAFALLRLGSEAEALAPPELRALMTEIAADLGRLYAPKP